MDKVNLEGTGTMEDTNWMCGDLYYFLALPELQNVIISRSSRLTINTLRQ